MSNIRYIDSKDTLMKMVKSPFASALVPTDIKIQKSEPQILPTVAPISYEAWQQIIGFLAWVLAEHNGEGLIIGYYHQANSTWLIEPPPQITNGMTVKENTALITDYKNPILGLGFIQMMTTHSHCDSSAFQSSTDREDEFVNSGTGFHITIGKLKQAVLDHHCRAKLVIPGQLSETGDLIQAAENHELTFALQNLIDTPPMPPGADNELIKLLNTHYLLTTASMNLAFPEEWKARVTRPQATTFHGVQRTGATWGNRLSWGEEVAISDKNLNITHSDIIAAIGDASHPKRMGKTSWLFVALYEGLRAGSSRKVPKVVMRSLETYFRWRLENWLMGEDRPKKTPHIPQPIEIPFTVQTAEEYYRGNTPFKHPRFTDYFPLFKHAIFQHGGANQVIQNAYDSAWMMLKNKIQPEDDQEQQLALAADKHIGKHNNNDDEPPMGWRSWAEYHNFREIQHEMSHHYGM